MPPLELRVPGGHEGTRLRSKLVLGKTANKERGSIRCGTHAEWNWEEHLRKA